MSPKDRGSRESASMDAPPEPRPEAGPQPSPMPFVILLGIVVFLYFVRSILLPFVVGGIVAFVCAPLIDGIARRARLPRWLCALAVLLGLIAIAGLILFIGLPPLIHQVSKVAGDLKGAVEGLVRALIGNRTLEVMGTTLNASTVATELLGAVRTWVTSGSHATEIITYLVAAIFGVILIWVVLGYALFDAPQIASGMMWLVPPQHRPFTKRVLAELDPLLRRYFIGVALVVAYASIAAYIGLGVALGISHAVVLAIITGVLELIPLVGPAAAAIIVGLVAVQQAASPGAILAFIAYAIALRVSIDQFFGPIVLGSAARVRPIVVMFCFLAGGLLFGIVGVILAVPIALTLKVILAVLYHEPHTEPR
ncbi:MAG TPA: AI-2E family transporter [Steroidobacteraceae bacterium]